MDNRNDTFIGSRWFYAICFAGLFVVETLIALFVRDAFIRPYMGDVLVVILVYCFVRMFITRPLRWLTLGTGLGGGIILNGKMFNGGMNHGVELGHAYLVDGGEPCTCGNHGCMEAY